MIFLIALLTKIFIYFDYFHNGVYNSTTPLFNYDYHMLDGMDTDPDDAYNFLMSFPLTLYNDSYSDADDTFKNYVDGHIAYMKDLFTLSNSNENIAKFIYEFMFLSFYPSPMPFTLRDEDITPFIYTAKYHTLSIPYWAIYVRTNESYYSDYMTYSSNPTNMDSLMADAASIMNIVDVLNGGSTGPKGEDDAKILASYYLTKLRLESLEGQPDFDKIAYFMYTEKNEDIFTIYNDYDLEDEALGITVVSTPEFESFKTDFLYFINNPGYYKFASTTIPLNISNVVDVKMSELGVFVLKENGDVYSLGPSAGHGGDNSDSFGATYVETFTKIPELSDVKEIYLFGDDFAFFSTNSGNLYSYGLNSEMLGLKPGINTPYVWTPTLVAGVSNVKDVKFVNYFSVITTNDGDSYISGTLGQSRSGGSTAYTIRLNLLEIPTSKPIANVYPLAETGSPKTYRSLIVYEDGTTEYVLKNSNYYSHHPIAQAIIKQASSITDVADIVTNDWAYVSVMTTNSGGTYAIGTDTSIFKDTAIDSMTTNFTLIDNGSFPKIAISTYGSKSIFIGNDGTLKYSGLDDYPEFNLSPVIPFEWDSNFNRTNGLALVNGIKVKGVSMYKGNYTVNENLVILDENNNIHNYGRIIIDTEPN